MPTESQCDECQNLASANRWLTGIAWAIGLLIVIFIGSQVFWLIGVRKSERFHITQRRLVAFQIALEFYFWDHDRHWPPLATHDVLKSLSVPEYEKLRENHFGPGQPWDAVDGFGNNLEFTLLPDGHVRVASAGPNGIHEKGAGDDIVRTTVVPLDSQPEQ